MELDLPSPFDVSDPDAAASASGLTPARLQALYERLRLTVFRRALRLLGREEDAWDVVQEVFQKLIEPVRYMERAVLDALASRKYEPAKQNGVPIDVRYTFNIRLVLPVDSPPNPPGKVQP